MKLSWLFLVFYTLLNVEAHASTTKFQLSSDKYNRLFITINVNGKTYDDFIFDLGAKPGLLVYKDFLKNIKGITYEKTVNSIDLAGNTMLERKFRIDSININGLVFKEITGIELQDSWGLGLGKEDSDVEDQIRYQAIGYDFIKGKIILLDVSNKILELSDNIDTFLNSEVKKKARWIALDYELLPEGIVLKLESMHGIYHLAIDSGAGHSVIKNTVLNKKEIIESCSVVFKEDPITCEVSPLLLNRDYNNQTIYPIILDDFPEEFKVDGLLGMDFLNKNKIILDTINKKIFIYKKEKGGE